MSEHINVKKQPRVFYFSTVTSAFERFSYYVLTMIFTIYTKNVYNLSDKQAFAFFAIFTALAYITPVIGGYLADNFFGIKRCMGIGIVLELIGNAILILPSVDYFTFILALVCIIVGCGFFKTAPTNLLGRAYKENDPRIDSGFTLFYMGMNIGGFFSSFIGGLGQPGHWNTPFYFTTGALIIGVIWFFLFKHHATEYDVEIGRMHYGLFKWFKSFLIVFTIIVVCVLLMYNYSIGRIFLYLSSAAVLFYFIFEMIRSSKDEAKAIFVCFILIMEVFVFNILYYQAFTSMVLFIERCVDRTFMGFSIPSVWFLSLDTIWIIVLSPVLAYVYKVLESKNKDLAITTKFPLGLTITAFCFISMILSSYFKLANGQTAMYWIVIAFFFFALGELMTSALGVAMVTRIAPKRLYGILMGAWFLLTNALGAEFAGLTAGLANVPEKLQNNLPAMFDIYNHTFLILSIIALATAVICFIISPILKRLAGLNK